MRLRHSSTIASWIFSTSFTVLSLGRSSARRAFGLKRTPSLLNLNMGARQHSVEATRAEAGGPGLSGEQAADRDEEAGRLPRRGQQLELAAVEIHAGAALAAVDLHAAVVDLLECAAALGAHHPEALRARRCAALAAGLVERIPERLHLARVGRPRRARGRDPLQELGVTLFDDTGTVSELCTLLADLRLRRPQPFRVILEFAEPLAQPEDLRVEIRGGDRGIGAPTHGCWARGSTFRTCRSPLGRLAGSFRGPLGFLSHGGL